MGKWGTRQMPAFEDQIRDELATRLSLLDDGLSLVATNYPLSNSRGTRGFIDLLALDRHGVFVVIELKRSNKTAREALHEVMKYTELLEQEMGVDSSAIRSAVVSTTWDELLVPFSHFKRGWSNEIRGYKLKLADGTATPVAAEEIVPVAEAPERGVSPIHLLVFGQQDGSDLDTAWHQCTEILSEAGADDVLGIRLKHPVEGAMLYLVLGRLVPEDPRTVVLDALLEDVPDDTIEAPEGYALEYRALCHMTKRFSDFRIGTAYPEKFAALTESGSWEIDSVLRAGVFERQRTLYDDESLLGQVVDRIGQSVVRFFGSSRPANRRHWDKFKTGLANSLVGNEAWRGVLWAWLEECATIAPQRDLFCKVYNPCDFMTMLVYGWPSQLTSYLPEIQAALDAPSPLGRFVRGTIVWGGRRLPSLIDAIRLVYREPIHWAISRSCGETWQFDLDLLDSLDLRYALFEWSEDYRNGALLELVDGNLRRQPPGGVSNGSPSWEAAFPLPQFARIHADEIDALVDEYRAFTSIDFAAGQQATWGA